uniref:ATP-grasp domain-containing protein n=1 Tax=Alexandrium catenella TaxID=2925 RepID=A0A7S1LDA9_ALECA|mmetsp:Transcript_11132/g.30329  ORF Transcript_11132/g.30329 Transcript_11132/m.30329 type:complete len:385 (+) Transcript_11132:1-1155(+)
MSQSSEAVYKAAEALIGDLGRDGLTGPVDAITTFVELSVPLTARLCEAFGVPGFRPESVDAARDKHKTRAALKAAGLPTPRNGLIRCEDELDAVGSEVGFPSVLKPVSGAASLGVKKVTCMSELRDCYREVVAELSSLVVSSGALVKADPSGVGVEAAKVVDLTVLLEQYLDGCEVDVDIVMSEGKWRYAAVSDNGPTLEPYFNETWGVCPSLLALHKQRELKDFAIRCLVALGFETGVFHVECRYTSTGPQLIEVNARMGGGPVHEHNLRTWGVDLVEETLFLALGIPARPPVPPAPYEAIAYYLVPAKSSGTLEKLPDLEGLRRAPGVIWARPLAKVGDHIVGPADGLPTWVVDVFVSRATAKEALDFVLKWEAENPPRIRP